MTSDPWNFQVALWWPGEKTPKPQTKHPKLKAVGSRAQDIGLRAFGFLGIRIELSGSTSGKRRMSATELKLVNGNQNRPHWHQKHKRSERRTTKNTHTCR